MLIGRAGAHADTDVVTLSGTSGTPNQANGSGSGAGWRFNSDGTVDRNQNGYVQFNASTEWVIPNNPSKTYYIRAQLDFGNAPDSGPTLGSWHALTTSRDWVWTTSANIGVLQIDIASDSGGTNILDTGYYQGFYL